MPDRFVYPHYYDMHEIAMIAVEELQSKLISPMPWNHDFGLDNQIAEEALGKMFGVLVVRDKQGNLGYLAAFSGKIDGGYHYEGFVPPVFDAFIDGDYFLTESREFDDMAIQIDSLVHDKRHLDLVDRLNAEREIINEKISKQKEVLQLSRKRRKKERENLQKTLSKRDFEIIQSQHKQQSINDHFLYNEYAEYLNDKIAPLQEKVDNHNAILDALRLKRKNKSNDLQKWLFAQYKFANANCQYKDAIEIFKDRENPIPPAGTGDCAAPKLLQYAFTHGLKPITMAEFWWGKSPSSQDRKHKYFYPACRGKCEPILSHMLSETEIDQNPLLKNPAEGKKLKIVYEDDSLVVVNKPAEFLSTPGKHIYDSVQSRMKAKYPKATGPMIVHRLDMSTSGLLLIAKSTEVYRLLQSQFIERTIKKRYVALLDGDLASDNGKIELPLRIDLENRPYQIVCYEYGKHAITEWQVINKKDKRTRVYFYPITGRTHQLRVHAAHHLGLNTPIVGDDLYGIKGDRLCLHAESITFTHPISGDTITVSVNPDF